MKKEIKITGQDICGWNGEDETGALKELGIKYGGHKSSDYPEILNKFWFVDIDFVLRHHLMNPIIYEKFYKKTDQYKKYYAEGAGSYNDKNLTCDNPYQEDENLFERRDPWGDGYREEERNVQFKKYKIASFLKEFNDLVEKYNLAKDFGLEYNDLMLKTPDGYYIELK